MALDVALASWHRPARRGRNPAHRSLETADGMEGAFTYSTDLFDAETITRMSDQFQTLLSLVAHESTIALSTLRATLNETDRASRNRKSERLEEAGRQKLKSIKRKLVMGTQAGSEDEVFSKLR